MNDLIIQVDLTAIEDMHQLGQFENLTNYLNVLLKELEKGARINLLRFPENDSPVSYGMITDTDQFTVWVAPLLN